MNFQSFYIHQHLCLACLSFYVKQCDNVPAGLRVPRLFVLRRVVGRVRPGGESPPRQRFLCLPRAKPSNGVGRTRPQRVTTL